MKISELIKVLEKKKEELGDIQVGYVADPYFDNDFLFIIKDVQFEEYPQKRLPVVDEKEKPQMNYDKGNILRLI